MCERLSLNGGDWQFKGFAGEEWAWRRAHMPASQDEFGWLRGTVPGSVAHDLWQAGQVPNPYHDRNSLCIEWVPQRTWVYKRNFRVPRDYRGRRLSLCFEGVDYEAHFFLNGEPLGTHRSMFTPAIFDVSERLTYGVDNLLAVVLEPAPREQPQLGRTSLVRTHKSRMNYGWDFCPPMPHVGIWDGVYLDVTGPARVEDCFVRPRLSDDLQHADVEVSVELDAVHDMLADLEVSLAYAGEPVASARLAQPLPAGRSRVTTCLEVADPHLWYPNGSGEPALYEAEVRVVDADAPGEGESDRRAVRFGVRKVEMVANQTPDRTALPYTFVVNGRPVYVKGWNWVPIDALYGVERPEKLERLLALARRANVNLLRVWGGGLIEKEAFYDLCDRYGIMVWQEFVQSSSGIDNVPADDPEFVAMMSAEARAIIPRKRNHASLVLWCGGNELKAGAEQPLDERSPVLRELSAAVRDLHPDALWLPTSPSGRVFSNSLENIARDPSALHDVHGPWHHQGVVGQFTLYNLGTSLFHSEFGVEGATNLKTLARTVAAESRWPVTRDNPVWSHLASWWIRESFLPKLFGDVEEIHTWVRASQFLQADGLRYAVEANRRRKYQNTGSLPWQFDEPYPNPICTSAVDYYARPKPAYYAVARAYEPVHLSARFPTQVWKGRAVFEAEPWVSNSRDVAMDDSVLRASLRGASGRLYAERDEKVSFGANCATPLFHFDAMLSGLREDTFFLDLKLRTRDGDVLAANRYVFSRTQNLAPLLAVPGTTLSVQCEQDRDRWRLLVTNTGDQAALFVWLEDGRDLSAAGDVLFGDDYFCLFPGEARTVVADWRGVPAGERAIDIGGWNTGAMRVVSDDYPGELIYVDPVVSALPV